MLQCFNPQDDSLGALYERLVKAFLTHLAESLGIEGSKVSINSYKQLYIPFMNRLSQAINHIKGNKLSVFKGLLKAMFEDRFWDFIEDTSQQDDTAKGVALHNQNIRNRMRSSGIDVENWLGKVAENRLAQHEFMYYEQSSYRYDPVNDARAVIDYALRVLNVGLTDGQIKDVTGALDLIGIFAEYDNKKAIGLKPKKPGKKKDTIEIIADSANLSVLLRRLDNLLGSDNVKHAPSVLETVTHAKETMQTLQARLSADDYRLALDRLRKSFIVRPILRNPGHDLFMGDFTSCCLAMNSNQFPQAMVERLTDEAMNVIEAIDETTGKTMACLWLYIAEDASLVIQNIEINAEYEKIEPMMNMVAEEMIKYTLRFTSHIKAKRLLIGIPGHGKYFANGFIGKRYKDKLIPFNSGKIGGYLNNEPYYLDSAEKPNAYLVEEVKNNERVVLTAIQQAA